MKKTNNSIGSVPQWNKKKYVERIKIESSYITKQIFYEEINAIKSKPVVFGKESTKPIARQLNFQQKKQKEKNHQNVNKKLFIEIKTIYYIVINIFLLISTENNRAIYPCICTLSIVIFGKVLMRSELVLNLLHHLLFGK